MDFHRDVVGLLRTKMKRSIAVPRLGDAPDTAAWSSSRSADGVQIVLRMDTAALCGNMQDDTPAAPFFAMCIAWWHEHFAEIPTTVVVQIAGSKPEGEAEARHWRRAQFLLSDLHRVSGGRVRVEPTPVHAWPELARLNSAEGERSTSPGGTSRREHAIEQHICSSEELAAGFPEPVRKFNRQLPIGVFEGSVSKQSAWTPGQASQIDLWAESIDGRTVHLVELKADGNEPLGIIPEALYYAKVLNDVRRGRIAPGISGFPAMASAERIVMWLAAPKLHPLVYFGGHSPLEWLNEGMKEDGVEMRILPIEVQNNQCVRWRTEEAWPSLH